MRGGKNDFYENPDFSLNPTATSFAAKKVAKIHKKLSISACGAKELPLVLSDRRNSLSIARIKGEGCMSETFGFLLFLNLLLYFFVISYIVESVFLFFFP